MRECPVSDRCLAADSCRRSCNLRSNSAPSDGGNQIQNRHEHNVSSVATLLQANDTSMNELSVIARIVQQEDLNFLLTNRIPRRLLTRLMGRVSRIENPLVCSACIALWRLFSDLDLEEAKRSGSRACMSALRASSSRARAPSIPTRRCSSSPSDAIVGACGKAAGWHRAAGQRIPVSADRSAAGSRTRELLPRRPVRDAAPDLQHVSPLSCAV